MPEKIRVHERALAHLSRGLYRSPASAIRELISNAWDANATIVRVNSNFPNFYQLSVSDDGDGFSKEEFSSLMSGGVGNSLKRTEGHKLKFGRPVIGRLGIGMLGIAQICGSFLVTSKTANGDTFQARVKLYDLAKEEMDEKESKLIHEENIVPSDGEDRVTVVDVGEYEFLDFDFEETARGTRILADDIHPTFAKSFQASLKLDKYEEVPSNWEDAVNKILGKTQTIQYIGDYWRLLWELSAACPLRYISDFAVPDGMIIDRQQKLTSYNFRLLVDGRELLKPVFLAGNKDGYTCIPIGPYTGRIYGRELKFGGYIAVQEGKQLYPDELRGIMIRIKNIGVGYYDPSMLDYRVNEGPRSRWVTGEIFVDEGLEDALNIDRDSFNRFHPQFRALQEHVHTVLHREVFPKVYKNIDIRSERKQATKTRSRTEALTSVIQDRTERSVTLAERPKKPDSDKSTENRVSLRQTKDSIELTVPAADTLKTNKRTRQLAQSILTIFEVALHEKNQDAQRKRFAELLLDLLKRW